MLASIATPSYLNYASRLFDHGAKLQLRDPALGGGRAFLVDVP